MRRMQDEKVPREALKGCIEGRKSVGRPRGRWLDEVDRDAKMTLKCRNWRSSKEDRDVWSWRVEEAKVQVELWHQRRRRIKRRSKRRRSKSRRRLLLQTQNFTPFPIIGIDSNDILLILDFIEICHLVQI